MCGLGLRRQETLGAVRLGAKTALQANRQSIGLIPFSRSHAFAREKWRQLRKSLRRLSGEGWPASSTRCFVRSIRAARLRAGPPHSRNAAAGRFADTAIT